MSEYFGNNSEGTSDNASNAGYYLANNDAAHAFTCPGSGTYNVLGLDAKVRSTHFRLAIYMDSLAFVAQGDAAISMADPGAAGWYGHTAFHNVAESDISPTLTGGSDYVMVILFYGDANPSTFRMDSEANHGVYNNGQTGFTDPITLPGGPNASFPCIRCLVEAAGGGGGVAIDGHTMQYVRRRKKVAAWLF